ncbi:DUF397 domain-containing protein [Streptomyces sp. SID13666]|uniref:DUF397 domain-containing protein n=1 Tax=unclassified Streptomyces TaxID=2593676 RepID=UPI0013C1FAF6|nr:MULTISPECIES: DUF397 domain-containing protein [unclassified Streptomyces]NEA55448.1 DUF397 domain-containing protein [Streptomyces sp. SID13666]NEA71650.1 DUF397 domain-containing protein [Streptomyces sp. SID13588]
MSDLIWFKSTYSGGSGGECIEIAYDWRKSTHSGGEGGECVEVAIHPTTVHIRDSKDPQGPALAVPASSWAAFVAFAAAQPS